MERTNVLAPMRACSKHVCASIWILTGSVAIPFPLFVFILSSYWIVYSDISDVFNVLYIVGAAALSVISLAYYIVLYPFATVITYLFFNKFCKKTHFYLIICASIVANFVLIAPFIYAEWISAFNCGAKEWPVYLTFLPILDLLVEILNIHTPLIILFWHFFFLTCYMLTTYMAMQRIYFANIQEWAGPKTLLRGIIINILLFCNLGLLSIFLFSYECDPY